VLALAAVNDWDCVSACVQPAGAIDVEELQYALEVMGIQKTAADVQELMDSVDKDGSGEQTAVRSLQAATPAHVHSVLRQNTAPADRYQRFS
jgi:hypothetical protein